MLEICEINHGVLNQVLSFMGTSSMTNINSLHCCEASLQFPIQQYDYEEYYKSMFRLSFQK